MRPMDCTWEEGLTARIREIRVSAFGARGRAGFARALGVSPSTYNYYERGRIPPIPTLLRMCDLTGVDLHWLLTGTLPPAPTARPDQAGESASSEHGKLLARVADLMRRRKEAGAAVNAFVDLLESRPESTSRGPELDRPSLPAEQPSSGSTRIPVLGRTAAGVPHFWKKRPKGIVELLHSAVARGSGSSATRAARLAGPEGLATLDSEQQVRLVQLTKPVRVGELSVAEFLDCPGSKDKWADAFALRIDGESMHPALSHGDMVILSPDQAARAGRPAVVQLRNQIGATCKLFYSDKTLVHLIPINEQFHPTKHPLTELVWALAVLYRVRLLGPPPAETLPPQGGG